MIGLAILDLGIRTPLAGVKVSFLSGSASPSSGEKCLSNCQSGSEKYNTPTPPRTPQECKPSIAACVQELDVAIIKSTTPQFHVPPKEKHVRSELSLALRPCTKRMMNSLTCATPAVAELTVLHGQKMIAVAPHSDLSHSASISNICAQP